MPDMLPQRLGANLDALAAALFFKQPLPARQQRELTHWIARRQGMEGAYCDMFAPADADYQGIRLFTGEWVRSRAGIGHLLGEEACRVLHALQPHDVIVEGALARAVTGMNQRLTEWDRLGYDMGMYCCGTCSTGYWRNLANGLFSQATERLQRGMIALAAARRGDGTWHRFPFFHTSLALIEIDPALTAAELRHAAPRWRRVLPRLSDRTDATSRRRAEVGRRFLALADAA